MESITRPIWAGGSVAEKRSEPFLNLATVHQPLLSELQEAIDAVIQANAFSGGPFVEKYEREFAAYCGCRFAAGVGSGTEALWLALTAVGVREGDEVITAPNSFFATAEAISMTGAQPVFADVDEHHYAMDPRLVERAITPRTRAIVPVHLYGQPAPMDEIIAIARAAGLAVVEDSAQAHGAEYRRAKTGTLADAGCFSFYPSKNLGAWGEAGGVTTNDPEIDRRVKLLRDHGQETKNHHVEVARNSRMDGIQAAVLSVKLRYLDAWNENRRATARLYDSLLEGIPGLRIPAEASPARHVYHLYVVQVAHRDAVLLDLAERGVNCGVHYPVPIHLQPAYRKLGAARGSLPVAEALADRILSLPLYPYMGDERVESIANALRAACRGES